MPVSQGNTASSVTKTLTVTGNGTVNFLITNISGGSATINLSLLGSSVGTLIAPKNLTLLTGETFEHKGIAFTGSVTFLLTTTASVDYYVWTA